MREKKYSKELGGTAGCSMRIIEATNYSGQLEKQRREAKESGKRELFLGDSWFTSRRLCDAVKRRLGHEYFGAMKTNHSGTPKAEVEEIMKDLKLETKDMPQISPLSDSDETTNEQMPRTIDISDRSGYSDMENEGKQKKFNYITSDDERPIDYFELYS